MSLCTFGLATRLKVLEIIWRRLIKLHKYKSRGLENGNCVAAIGSCIEYMKIEK